jgi:hypothetical protein
MNIFILLYAFIFFRRPKFLNVESSTSYDMKYRLLADKCSIRIIMLDNKNTNNISVLENLSVQSSENVQEYLRKMIIFMTFNHINPLK